MSNDLDELCAACGATRREHITPGGTRYGPNTLCGVFIPGEPVGEKQVMLTPPFEIYRNNNEIADSNGHVCTAENLEIARMILLALRAYYEPSTDKVPPRTLQEQAR